MSEIVTKNYKQTAELNSAVLFFYAIAKNNENFTIAPVLCLNERKFYKQ